jgi:GDP-4-dehydro-6-deoxy-D-mannose reductase
MKTVLITGMSGFIGSNLKTFIEKNYASYEVYGIDTDIVKPTKRYFKADLTKPELIISILKKIRPEYIFHLAGIANAEKFSEFIQKNVIITNLFLDSIEDRKNCQARIIIPGSSSEYGEVCSKTRLIRETAPLRPINPYGISKMYQTMLALSYQKKGLDIVIGRIFNITGSGTPPSLSIGKFASDIALIEKGKKEAVIRTKDLESKRDFLDIEDVCSGLMAVAEKGASGETYNVCSARSYKIKFLLEYLVSLSNVKNIKIKSVCLSKLQKEVKNICGSNEKIKKNTGWQPKIKIKESLKKTLDYYRQISE